MNVPNQLSLFRVAIIPVFVLLYYLDGWTQNDLYLRLLAPVFVLASLTDFLDGYLARKHNLVTVFGKFIDPLADKLLVMAALVVLNAIGTLPIWVTIVILSREFLVTGIRLVAVGEGNVIAASPLGKYKTASTMIGLILMLLFPYGTVLSDIGLYVVYLGTVLTIVSGFDYFWNNRTILLQSM
jgi:CDP-diacylglycerol--glycerol-3-phosphate 3-phosphatidyltransferase